MPAALPLALQLRQVPGGVRAVDEGGDLRVQGLGDALQGVQVRLGLVPLPGGDRLAGDVKLLRQLLLGELFRHAELADVLADGRHGAASLPWNGSSLA